MLARERSRDEAPGSVPRITAAGATSYTVNANGNLTARGADSFGYDQANRLKSLTVGGATSTDTWDGDGKRGSATVGGTTTSFMYDVSGKLPVLLSDGSRKYVYGCSGLAYEVDGAGNVQVAHTDGLGSVRALIDGSGSLSQTYRTDPFGVPTATQGTSTQPFGFTGEQRDAESGLVYLRARMYDPQIGRFLQRDTFAKAGPGVSGWNRYAYAADNPVTVADPSGHCLEDACILELAAAAYVASATTVAFDVWWKIGGREQTRAAAVKLGYALDEGWDRLGAISDGLGEVFDKVGTAVHDTLFAQGGEEERDPAQDRTLSPGENQGTAERGRGPGGA